jgi:hypothetical protein
VFIDEPWASTNMARRRGRALRGERLKGGISCGHWKTTTFLAGLRIIGMMAPIVLNGPINPLAFQAYVEQVLVPRTQTRRDIVVLDNLSSHKRPCGPPSYRSAAAPYSPTSTPSRTPLLS